MDIDKKKIDATAVSPNMDLKKIDATAGSLSMDLMMIGDKILAIDTEMEPVEKKAKETRAWLSGYLESIHKASEPAAKNEEERFFDTMKAMDGLDGKLAALRAEVRDLAQQALDRVSKEVVGPPDN